MNVLVEHEKEERGKQVTDKDDVRPTFSSHFPLTVVRAFFWEVGASGLEIKLTHLQLWFKRKCQVPLCFVRSPKLSVCVRL